MPVTVSYPGVYVQETQTVAHAIKGAPTSITAFLGRTWMGPVDQPTQIESFGDFERGFGGLVADCPLSYAVRDFYANGGGTALIVRLIERSEQPARATLSLATTVSKASAAAKGDQQTPLVLEATSEGVWGNGLSVTVDRRGQRGAHRAARFNLTASLTLPSGVVRQECFTGVTLDPAGGARRLDTVLNAGSALLRARTPLPLGVRVSDDVTKAEGGHGAEALRIETYLGDENVKTGLFALEAAAGFNILCIPPDENDGDTEPYIYRMAAEFCVRHQAVVIIDPPRRWTDLYRLGKADEISVDALGDFAIEPAQCAAVYFPRILARDPLRDGQERSFAASGAIAGLWSAMDVSRGVWKPAAGISAELAGITGLEIALDNAEIERLNLQGIVTLRDLPRGGTVVWGARTLAGREEGPETYRYIPERRACFYISQSITRSAAWAAFEPNDAALWAKLRQSAEAFLSDLHHQGALAGASADQAYSVRCDATTTTQADIDEGVVVMNIDLALREPSKFMPVRLVLPAGQSIT